MLTVLSSHPFPATTSGYTVNNTVFDSGSGVQVSTLKIDSPTADKYYTCYMDVNNVQVSVTAMVQVDVIVALWGTG